VSGAATGPDAPFWFAAWFFVLIPGGLLWLAGADLVPPGGPTRFIGAFVIVAAHVPLIPLVASFVIHGRGTHAPFDPPRQMVARGIYRRVRNPMYLLYTAVILGEAIAYRSPILLAYAALFWLLAHFLVVNVEEKTLRKRFGDDYETYCREVPRWLPRLRAHADR
jgi:protein-S-isoprenylcysteine O-methyltransferase Ste14